jgi:hypothetical protein
MKLETEFKRQWEKYKDNITLRESEALLKIYANIWFLRGAITYIEMTKEDK